MPQAKRRTQQKRHQGGGGWWPFGSTAEAPADAAVPGAPGAVAPAAAPPKKKEEPTNQNKPGLFGRLFGSSDTPTNGTTAATGVTVAKTETNPEEGKGLFYNIGSFFGIGKKNTEVTPVAPAAGVAQPQKGGRKKNSVKKSVKKNSKK